MGLVKFGRPELNGGERWRVNLIGVKGDGSSGEPFRPGSSLEALRRQGKDGAHV